MNNKISARQLYFFLACVLPVGKLIVLPPQLAGFAANDLLIPAAVHFLLQSGVIFCVLLLARRGMSFFELLENSIGKVAAKIAMTMFAVFLFYASLLPLMEQKLFVQGAFYDTLPSLIAFSPFFVFSAYVCSKPLGADGRTWDLLGPFAICGLAGVLILSVGSAKYASLLPIAAPGTGGGIFKGITTASSWFYDGALVLMLLGKFDYRKGMAWKGLLCYLAGAIATLFFIATFYGIYQETAINQLFAFTQTSKYFSGITVLGRVDYLFIFALGLVMVFLGALPIQAAVDCCVQAYGRHKFLPFLLSLALNGILLVLLLVLDFRFGDVMNVIAGTMYWVYLIFCVLVPLLALLLLIRRPQREIS